jgi:RNA polymerase sigma factor (sigma-70 family)
MQNPYQGIVDDETFASMYGRARRLGLAGADLDDALQEIVMEVSAFRYDPTRSNGCEEHLATSRFAEGLLRNARRKQYRANRRQEMARERQRKEDTIDTLAPASIERELDIRAAVETLSDFDRQVFEVLSLGMNVREVAERMDCRWHTAQAAIERIRQKLAQKELHHPLSE